VAGACPVRRISVLAVLVVALVAVGRSFGIGAWAATGPTTEDLTFHGLLADEDGQPVGMFTARAAIEVAADG
jgi:hypothetical protein